MTITISSHAILITVALLGYCALFPVCFLLSYAGAHGDHPEGEIGTAIFFFMFSLPSTIATIALGWDFHMWIMGWGLCVAAFIVLGLIAATIVSIQQRFEKPYTGPDHFRVRTDKDLETGTLGEWLKEHPEQSKGYSKKEVS